MRLRRLVSGLLLIVGLGVPGAFVLAAQQSDPNIIEHAKRVLTLLGQQKFDEVSGEFNGQLATLLPAGQLRDVWAALRQQFGDFSSYIDQQVRTPAPGVTAVVLGCQFQKTSVNVVVSFDADGRIAGLRFVPRQPAPAAAAAPPSSLRFTEEAVMVGSGEWTLPGTLTMPIDRVEGAVVLVHGSGPGDRDETIGPNKPFRDLAWGLADRGIAVLRYEKRTRQYADRVGRLTTFTVREETIDDALAAVETLRAHDRIDPARVFVLGHSLGGTLAPRIGEANRSLAGLIVMAGATRPIQQVAREQLTYIASLGPAGSVPQGSIEAALQLLLKSAPPSYWQDLDAYKPAPAAAALNMPMLILQGERDYQVTLEDLQGWRDALAGRANVTIKSYPTLNHLFLPGMGKSTPSEYEKPDHIPDFVLDDIRQFVATSSAARP
jgi:dienelactone hydrolase